MPTPPDSTISRSENQADTQDVKSTVSTGQNSTRVEQQANTTQNPQKPQKSRHRASVACASCRDRRIRCVVPAGQKECTQCKRSGVECVIKNDDERRRPISRAYMCSLTDRVALLEGMLKERGEELPPANHPPKTRHATRNEDGSPNRKSSEAQGQQQDNSSPGSQPSPQDEFIDVDQDNGSHQGEADSAGSPSMLPPPKRDGMVSRLLSTRGHLSFDQLSGRLRYFGPTTNCHVHSELGNPQDVVQETTEQARRAEKIIRSLPMETYDYLMDLFWQCYNPVIHVLHQESFMEDREAGRTQFYSGFLHICVLAMGFRFAEKSRPDIQKISLPQMESTLHREAKYMLDQELERPGGIPSVVAMLLLGDLECGVGRDNLGWLYGGLAVRLAFDIGLHLDTRLSGLPEREVEIRQMTLWACVIYDKYWALFLGRPTSMKSADLEIYSLSKQFERLGTCRPAGPEKSMETQIYEALLDLMELAGKITENMDPRSQSPESAIDRNQYLRMAALDREFSSWYARLPEQLRWTPANIATAPFSFFLLHQQYHSSLILLHRPFAMYEDQTPQGYEGSGPDDHFSALSRTVCTKHAIRVARIFWQHRQRFDTRQIFVTGLQHAGTAATALVAALAFIKDPNDRNNNMQYLECLSAALQDMGLTYQPASRMSVVLRAVVIELRGSGPVDSSFKLYKPKSALVPARRGSSTNDMESVDPSMFKRRQMSRPRAGTNSSRKSRSMSMSTSVTDMGISIKQPSALATGSRFDAESERSDGYIMVTPRSEISTWPPLDATPGLDPNLTTATPSTLSTSAGTRNAWMGAELDPSDSISQLANVHFPEIPALSEAGDANLTHLDFMALGDGAGDWSREWNGGGDGINVGSDLDGFPPQGGGGFGMSAWGKEGFGGMMGG
ncbi:fungal-specific transcription factor domain-containing protein [Dendryphion nanum]|uniref:Fungal-specific transcription factor domain-containing protein n=1 Tax=Dendryphion nanum TaxID=256645 RepID=A0A9P9DLA3_9PLEO|nr:fungal-specific transcription factor domain-containing protein [Dendryphion nanum]